jgi:heat-inducible transcriptional repressor
MDERTIRILTAVVENYIETAEPVGSRTLTKRYDFGLSPATIRNIMADLEDIGLLMQPHTSAGRMPTGKGYRYYVNNCMAEGVKDERLPAFRSEVQARLDSIKKDVSSLLEDVARELSRSSHHIGITVAPRMSKSRLSRVELIQVKGPRVLAVVITEEGIVKNFLIELEESIAQKHLNKISAWINRTLCGLTYDEARRTLVRQVCEDKAVYDILVSRAMHISREIVDRQTDENIYVGGYSEVLAQPDFVNIDAIKDIFRAIEDKHMMLRLLGIVEQMDDHGVTVLIGSENPIGEMHDCSMVFSPYLRGGKVIGTVGVIGPIRMHYPEVISMVDNTAQYLTNVYSDNVFPDRQEGSE